MRGDLIDKMSVSGYWRINIRPAAGPNELILGRCLELVEKSAVSIRGWDFPHISRGMTSGGGCGIVDTYVESWTDWSGFIEFWRMYPSGQFLSYIALREETLEGMFQTSDKGTVSVDNTIYSFTEFFEFSHRLSLHDIYPDGIDIYITLKSAPGRRLSHGGDWRTNFIGDKSMMTEQIKLHSNMPAVELQNGYREQAVLLLEKLFDKFGWNPGVAQIAAVQDRFYRKQF